MRTGRLSPSWSVISVRSIVLPGFVQGRQPATHARGQTPGARPDRRRAALYL